MQRPFTLSGRRLEILSSVARNYIATGEPVGSKTVAGRRRDKLSPASVRNVMAELEEAGYLTHPHTSAGRLPTEKGLRQYVQHLETRRLGPSEADYVEDCLGQATTLEERLVKSSQVLAALTQQVGIVVLAPLSKAVLEHVQFVRLADRRVLVVLVARGDVVRHRIIRLAEETTAEELDRIAGYVNHHFTGWEMGAARLEILRRLAEERAAFDDVLRRLRVLCLEGFLSAGSESQVYLDGTPNLMGGVQTVEAERVRQLLAALEEKQRLIELLDECLRSEMTVLVGDSLAVLIGLEEAIPAMRDFALIGTTGEVEPGVASRLAVIGPTRMHYERVISAVAHVASVFHELGEAN